MGLLSAPGVVGAEPLEVRGEPFLLSCAVRNNAHFSSTLQQHNSFVGWSEGILPVGFFGVHDGMLYNVDMMRLGRRAQRVRDGRWSTGESRASTWLSARMVGAKVFHTRHFRWWAESRERD